MAGLPSGRVTLSFTERLLEDLVVKPVIERYGESGMNRAATMIGGGVGSTSTGYSKAFKHDFGLADMIASIHLSIGFSTQSSWRIARWQTTRYNNHFALLTPSEKTEMKTEGMRLAKRARDEYGSSSPSYAPTNEKGQFIPIDLQASHYPSLSWSTLTFLSLSFWFSMFWIFQVYKCFIVIIQ